MSAQFNELKQIAINQKLPIRKMNWNNKIINSWVFFEKSVNINKEISKALEIILSESLSYQKHTTMHLIYLQENAFPGQ